MLQYQPYAAGRGRIVWAKRPTGPALPVLSALTTIRRDFDDGACSSPQETVDLVNTWLHARRRGPTSASLRLQCWLGAVTICRPTPDLADHNGKLGPYQAASYVRRHLDPAVRVVTPSALLELLAKSR